MTQETALLPELVVSIGQGCWEGMEQLVITLQVSCILGVDGPSHQSQTTVEHVTVQKIWDVELCDNKLHESCHDAIQQWLERDYKANSKDSHLHTAILEDGRIWDFDKK